MAYTDNSSSRPCALVVDDDLGARNLNSRLLSIANYECIVCETAEEALKAYEAAPENFDLVVTDLKMPDMDGETLAENIHQKDPNLPIILITGTSFSVKNESLFVQIIKKPFNPKEFIEYTKSLVNYSMAS